MIELNNGLISHKDTCKLAGQNYDSWNNPKGTCDAYTFEDWLPHIAPELFWFNIQDVGSYQGSVYGVALYKDQIVIYEDYYGSCSGCGAWGEGGEPISQDDVLSKSKLFDTKEETLVYIAKMDKYESPDIDAMNKAIDQALEFKNTEHSFGSTESKS